MTKQASFVVYLCILSGLVACSPPPTPDPFILTGESPTQASTVTVQPSQTIQATFPLDPSPIVRSTRTPRPTLTDTPVQMLTAVVFHPTRTTTGDGANHAPPVEIKCEAAQAGRPIDISVPDDTAFQPGERFTKIWRVVNTGACTWNADYAVVWFSGDDLGLTWTQPIGLAVEPGQTVDLSVDMAAPENPGVYQGNWKLSNSQGSLFGIGPNSDAPFWVRIVVNPAYTPTPEPTVFDATAAAPPVILAQGLKNLVLDQGVDLNMWNNDPVVVEDFMLQTMTEEDESQHLLLAPVNGAGAVYFGLGRPSFSECLQAQVSEEPLALANYPPGAYYCYRTADKMPGRMLLSNIDAHNSQIALEYITWVVP